MSEWMFIKPQQMKERIIRHAAPGLCCIPGEPGSSHKWGIILQDRLTWQILSGAKNTGYAVMEVFSLNGFASRTIGLVLVIGSLAAYQVTGTVREKDDEIARLNVQVEEAQNELAITRSHLDSLIADSAEAAAEEEEGLYKDGTYTGSGQGYGGEIHVTVTVSGGEITDITVDAHDGEDPAFYTIATGIIDKIIEAQSADVDTITGATLSSTGIKNAVAAALEGAANN